MVVDTRDIITSIPSPIRMSVGPVVRIRVADYGSDRAVKRSATRCQGLFGC